MTRKPKQQDDERGIGDNLSPEVLMALCADQSAEMDKVDEQRALLNETANKIRAAIREKGIDTDAWNTARIHAKKDPDKRQIFDMSYQLTRKALGTEPQSDLFEG